MEKYDRVFSAVEIRDAKYSFGAPFSDFMEENPSDIYRIQFKPARDTRNTRQNSLYWAIVHTITDWENKHFDRGWHEDDTHRHLKAEYFINPDQLEEIVRNLWNGELSTQEFLIKLIEISDKVTTTDKEEGEFARIVDKIIRDYKDKGLIIENPNNPPLSSYNDF